MYGYIYDVFLKTSNKKYEKELIKIENTLTDLGLKGSITRLSLINNVRHAVEDMIQKGVRTIVAVGSDQLFSKIADQADLLNNTALGLIPMGEHQLLANLLGIPEGHEACKCLAARLLKTVSLGKINNAYLIHSAVIEDPRTKVLCDKMYHISATTDQAIVSIHNLHETQIASEQKLSTMISPVLKQGLFSKSQIENPTVIQSREVEINEPKNIPVIVDGQKVLKTPVHIEIVPQKIKVIVGRERKV